MGFLMENGKHNRYYDEINNRWKSETIKNGLQLTTSFRNGLSFSKAGVSFNCYGCGKERLKGIRYLCKEYEKICVDCAIKWIEGSEETLKEMAELLERSRAELLANKDIWRREMILGSIEEGNS